MCNFNERNLTILESPTSNSTKHFYLSNQELLKVSKSANSCRYRYILYVRNPIATTALEWKLTHFKSIFYLVHCLFYFPFCKLSGYFMISLKFGWCRALRAKYFPEKSESEHTWQVLEMENKEFANICNFQRLSIAIKKKIILFYPACMD